jgi:hypothetical protein
VILPFGRRKGPRGRDAFWWLPGGVYDPDRIIEPPWFLLECAGARLQLFALESQGIAFSLEFLRYSGGHEWLFTRPLGPLPPSFLVFSNAPFWHSLTGLLAFSNDLRVLVFSK